MALEADGIGPKCANLALRSGFGEREHVLRYHAVATDQAMASHTAKLMDPRKGADHGIILDDDMSRQGGPVRKNGMVAYDAIVRDVCIGHKQVPVADSGDPASALRSPVHGDEFTKSVAFADCRLGSFSMEFQVLGNRADRRI